MSKTNDLILPLIKQWFYMIASGEKPEEYREITPYWCNRFLDVESLNMRIEDCSVEMIELMIEKSVFSIKQFSKLTFTLGYPRKEDTSRRMTFQNPKIRIGTGRPEWGAEKGKKYFVINWEDRIYDDK